MTDLSPRDPFSVTRALRERLARAVVAQTASSHAGLNAWLLDQLSGSGQGALLADPVVEGAPPYPTANQTIAELAPRLLHSATVDALDSASEQRFPRDRHPYRHQIEAWEILCRGQPRSLLVSSGTGSGKTECFLVPLIDSLAREDASAAGEQPLVGVRAIMLYPLNALISSQRERLSAWTRPFGGRIRYALYNSLLERRQKAQDYARMEREAPEQVHDRVHMWDRPPPILVTNVTMLEYLTIRSEDRPLLEKSLGRLRWVILDEAHSYIGSAAAEIALLLRRVLMAFGVEGRDVRFVATSATIGRGDSEGQRQLRRFLADLAGVGEDQVSVVIGAPSRWVPPGDGPDGPLHLDDQKAIGRHPRIRQLAEVLQSPGGLTLSKVEEMLGGIATPEQALGALARVDHASGRPLLPIRLHRFLRAVPGLWSCVNPACQGPKPEDWSWGAVLHHVLESCPHCGSLVLEIETCKGCGTPVLTALDDGDRLRPRRLPPDADEFAADTEAERELPDEEETTEGARQAAPLLERLRLFGAQGGQKMTDVWIDPKTGRFSDKAGTGLRLYATRSSHDPDQCPFCNAGNPKRPAFRPIRFGAPFLIGNAAPVLLEGVTGTAPGLPGEGRRLLSFTDSRQGTARFAASIETNGERNHVRAFLFHLVQKAGSPDVAALAELDQQIAGLEAVVRAQPALVSVLEAKRAERTRAAGEGAVPWQQALHALAQDPVIDNWIRREVWARRDRRFEAPNSSYFARFLLLRELARRPARANAVETLGLARLRFPLIDTARLPDRAERSGADLASWREFLYLLVDRARSSLALNVPAEDIRWLIPRGGRRRNLIPPGQEPAERSDLIWPLARAQGRQPAVVQILAEGLRLSLASAQDRAVINALLEEAWQQLRPLFETPGSTYALDLSKAEIAPVREAWLCPVTRRVITARAFGKTPYGIFPASNLRMRCLEPAEFPALPVTFPRDASQRESIEQWLATDARVEAIRRKGLWNDLHDRAALLAPYIRAEEHSAQQDPERLRHLEQAFTRGEVNLLACSTTMEMGVDIGPVESVLMTNVPPAIANYRQRIGRAGRRGQGFSTALTLARDTVLDRVTFADPAEYLQREPAMPRVSLDAPRIVQRHANALALGHWLASQGAQLHSLASGRFLGLPEDIGAARNDHSPATQFVAWLSAPESAAELAKPLARLLQGTALAREAGVLASAYEAFSAVEQSIRAEWEALQAEGAQVHERSAKKSVEYRLQRLLGEPLMAMLADRGVLPSHGFPGHVVAFVPDCAALGADENTRIRQTYPTRTVAVALREYAPGAEVVIDGLVWRSAGVTLNWLAPPNAEGVQEVQALRWHWTCLSCGAADTTAVQPQRCSACQSSRLERVRFLEPSGFRVDWTAEPHTESDQVQWIEPMPSRVSVRGEPWLPLLDPALGRMRSSHDGLVFDHSLGIVQQGYHICLACGRASEERDGLKGHRSLAPRKKGDGACPGNDHPFLVQGPLALGCETRTDVTELQLIGLADSGEAWALAAGLRRALCARLGVETAEIGLAIQPATGLLDERTHSIFLFDRSSGGAGLSPQLLADLPGLMQDAEAILDCSEPGCTRGCGACVLSPDLHRNQDRIDRRPALERARRLREALSSPVDDPKLQDARRSRPVADVLAATVSKADRVTIFVRNFFEIPDLDAQPLPALAAAISGRGGKLALALAPLVLEGRDAAWRLGLRDAAKRLGLGLALADPPPEWIALREGSDGPLVWKSPDSEAARIGENWGASRTGLIVRGRPAQLPERKVLDPDQLLPPSDATVIELEPGEEVQLREFGQWFASLLKPYLAKIDGWRPGRLQRLRYSDRYIRSPLVLLQATRAIAGLRDALDADPSLPVEIRTGFQERLKPPSRILHDYMRQAERDNVLHELANVLKLKLELSTTSEHARRLELVWSDGRVTVVFMDKGFGWLTVRLPPSFRFEDPPRKQAEVLGSLSVVLVARDRTYLACRVMSQGVV